MANMSTSLPFSLRCSNTLSACVVPNMSMNPMHLKMTRYSSWRMYGSNMSTSSTSRPWGSMSTKRTWKRPSGRRAASSS